jgi:hypothetical protein
MGTSLSKEYEWAILQEKESEVGEGERSTLQSNCKGKARSRRQLTPLTLQVKWYDSMGLKKPAEMGRRESAAKTQMKPLKRAPKWALAPTQ